MQHADRISNFQHSTPRGSKHSDRSGPLNRPYTARPDASRLSAFPQTFNTAVAFLQLSIRVIMNHTFGTDRLTYPAAGTFPFVNQNQSVFFFTVNGSVRALLHAQPAVYASLADIFLKILFCHRSNSYVTVRILFFRQMMLRDASRITCIASYAFFYIKP